VFRVVVERAGADTRVIEIARDSFAIGRMAVSGVMLDHPEVAIDHARIDTLDGVMFVRAKGAVRVNHREVTVCELAAGARIAIGPFTLAIERVDDDTEKRLLAAIIGGDEHSRDIYADWLEEHGEPLRARYLRLLEHLRSAPANDPTYAAATSELRDIGVKLRTEWRMQVERR